MSNGVKIGLFVVLAAGLGFATVRLVNANNGEIETRTVSGETAGTTTPSTINAAGDQGKPQSTTGEASRSREKTSMKFEKSEHDFGKMKQGDAAEYSFKFTNTGDKPLIIEDAKGSCGCTVPSYPKEPLAPGATAEMKVKFNSAGKSGPQQKTVTITANTEPITTVLTIKADVDAPAGGASTPAKH